MALIWEDPPPTTRGRGSKQASQWQAVADQLAQNPGQWAAVAEVKTKATAGVTRQLHKLGVETACRATTDGMSKVYARAPQI